MAGDIYSIDQTNTTIRHGNIFVSTPGTGVQKLDSFETNTPTIANISGKYIDRFDEITYYAESGA